MSAILISRDDPGDPADHVRPAAAMQPACGQPRRWLSQVCQRRLLERLSCINDGRLYLDDGCHRTVVGDAADDGLEATVMVRNERFYRRLVSRGSLGAAESYLDGDWDADDLVSLFRLFGRHLNCFRPNRSLVELPAGLAARGRHWLSRNSKNGSRRNIRAHYDLGNAFFELFLDPTMMYSSAMFESPGMTLEQAQVSRLNHICRQLDLRPEHHVIEIGTGWGGFALHAAQTVGCRVTTTTISPQQYEYARNRVQQAGLNDRVTVLLKDYRDLTRADSAAETRVGQFDRLVSLEMIEAVGREYYPRYFRICEQLLKPNSQMLLQAIVMPEQRYSRYLRSVDFIQKYIFPGGCLPSVTALQTAATGNTSMRLVRLDDFADGYAQTTREWRSRFHKRLADVRRQGFDERFLRTWDYYLAYCEAAFRERTVGVVQAVWERQLR
ncbi:MAG: cyclopropane-fatty-acyl-phospholipid synthase family protein [Planctomycetaceae bacterium]